jgi:hypothetical protein
MIFFFLGSSGFLVVLEVLLLGAGEEPEGVGARVELVGEFDEMSCKNL